MTGVCSAGIPWLTGPAPAGWSVNTMLLVRCLGLSALVALALLGCDGSGSSSGGGSDPPAAATDLLVYRSYPNPAQLYKLDTRGRATQLSDALVTGGFSNETDYVVSPDRERVAFAYTLGDGRYALGIKRISNGELEEPNPVFDGLEPTSIQWQPDSRGLVFAVWQAAGANVYPNRSALYLATLGEADPVKLMGDQAGSLNFGYAMSADGSALAVQTFLRDTDAVPEPPLGSLYLLDLAAPGSPLLLDTLKGGGNAYAGSYYFKWAWSPYANELLYQQRETVAPDYRYTPDDYARGPLMLADMQGSNRVLREVDDPWYVAWTWLDAQKILVAPRYRFEIIGTDGTLRAGHASSGPVVPSPDAAKLAFLDSTGQLAPEGEVLALDLETLEYRDLGPGTIFSYVPLVPYYSDLRWSPDSTQLAWNRLEMTDDGIGTGELYAHDFIESRTWTLIPGESAPRYLPWFSWLPDGGALNYDLLAGESYQLTVTDLATDATRGIGQNCSGVPAWRSNSEVLWNHCGDGLALSELKDGAYRKTRLLDTEARDIVLTGDRNIAVVHPAVLNEGNTTNIPDANWQAYDFATGRLQELEGTGGTPCCGTLLQ